MRRLFGNAIQQFYGQLTITAPTAGGTALTVNTFAGSPSALTLNASAVNDIVQIVNGTTLGQAAIQFQTAGAGTAILATAGTTNQLITGALVGDMLFRVTSGGLRFSTNAGTSSALAISSGGIVTVANAIVSSLTGGSQFQLTTFGAGSTLQNAFQYFSDNNLYIDAPQTGTPAGGGFKFRVTGAATALSISGAGNVSVAAPSSGISLTVNPQATNATTSILASNLNIAYGTTFVAGTSEVYTSANALNIGTSAAFSLGLYTNAANRLGISSTGGVNINAPSSGNTLAVTGIAGTNGIVLTSAGTSTLQVVSSVASADASIHFDISGTDAFYIGSNHSGSTNGVGVLTGNNYIYTNQSVPIVIGVASVARLTVFAGVQLGAPTGGDQGTGTINATGLFVNANPVYAGIPQNLQAGTTYTLVLADANKHILGTNASAKTFTVPANASVAFPIGTAITLINSGAGALSIPITTDTLILANTGTTGTRTVATNGIATLLKITANIWIASGPGVT